MPHTLNLSALSRKQNLALEQNSLYHAAEKLDGFRTFDDRLVGLINQWAAADGKEEKWAVANSLSFNGESCEAYCRKNGMTFLDAVCDAQRNLSTKNSTYVMSRQESPDEKAKSNLIQNPDDQKGVSTENRKTVIDSMQAATATSFSVTLRENGQDLALQHCIGSRLTSGYPARGIFFAILPQCFRVQAGRRG